MTNPYDVDLDRNPANFQPLTPLGFLERAAAVYPAHTAIVHGPLRRTYAEFYARTRRLASALAKRGIKRGEPGASPWTAGFDIDDFGGSVPRLVQAAGCQVWSPLYRNAKPDDVAAAKALGLKVLPWTVNERAEMERLIALGVDGIITDYPDRLRALMAEKEIALPPQVKAR